MKNDLSVPILKAMDGIKHDGTDLQESDALLRDDLIHHKLDYLCALMPCLAALVLESQKIGCDIAHERYNKAVMKPYNQYIKAVVKSIEQYKERRSGRRA